MGPPYSYSNATQSPNPSYPSQPEQADACSYHRPCWPNNYHGGGQLNPGHFQRQSYLPDRIYRPSQEAFQRSTPLFGRVSEVPPSHSSPSLNLPQIRTDWRLPCDRFPPPPRQPLPSPSQHSIEESQSRGSEFSSSCSSITQREAMGTFLEEKCQPRKSIDAGMEMFVDLATMLEEFEHIVYLSAPISRDYIKKLACLRCSETGQQEYKGLILDYNSGDTLFNLFVRGVKKAYDLPHRDQLKRNITVIANSMDLLAKDNNSDSPIFQTCAKRTLDQEENYSRWKKILSETEQHSPRKNPTDQPQELGRKRRTGALETFDDHTLSPQEATRIQKPQGDQQPQQPRKKRATSRKLPSIENSSDNLQPDFTEDLTASEEQSPLKTLELSRASFVDRILREADASKRQLPPIS